MQNEVEPIGVISIHGVPIGPKQYAIANFIRALDNDIRDFHGKVKQCERELAVSKATLASLKQQFQQLTGLEPMLNADPYGLFLNQLEKQTHGQV